jgi:hypothetical protein
MDWFALLQSVGGATLGLVAAGAWSAAARSRRTAHSLDDAARVDLRPPVGKGTEAAPVVDAGKGVEAVSVVHDGAWVAVSGIVAAEAPLLSMNHDAAAVIEDKLYREQYYAAGAGGIVVH